MQASSLCASVSVVDINECDPKRGLSHCEYKCVNIPGSLHCICPDGYEVAPDGYSCIGKSSANK